MNFRYPHSVTVTGEDLVFAQTRETPHETRTLESSNGARKGTYDKL